MKYNIILSPGAVREFRALSAFEGGQVRAGIERHLRNEPARLSRSQIKRLRGLRRPQYRLWIGDIRVFYDVIDDQVQILTILGKAQVEAWLKERGTPNEEDRSR
jgi:mRNA-degrading endonuclease RelE of RelBE toxin-antitoxin system